MRLLKATECTIGDVHLQADVGDLLILLVVQWIVLEGSSSFNLGERHSDAGNKGVWKQNIMFVVDCDDQVLVACTTILFEVSIPTAYIDDQAPART